MLGSFMDAVRGVPSTEAAGHHGHKYNEDHIPLPPPQGTAAAAGVVTIFSVENDETRPASHRFVNATKHDIEVLWLDYAGCEKSYATLRPGGRHLQPTFTTHAWLLRGPGGRLLGQFAGPDSDICIEEGRNEPIIKPLEPFKIIYSHPEWGTYQKRGESCGLNIMAFDCVSDAAVRQVEHMMQMMVQHTSDAIKRRLVEAGADIAIIGRNQATTDIPCHQHMKGLTTADGRCFDDGCRGLGGTPAIPTSSVAEENCLMVGDKRYASESILVHEFGHAVMNIGMDKEQEQRVKDAYSAAKEEGIYDPGCYMMSNADEYWAEAVQAWFYATERSDVNSGIKDRESLLRCDPRLADLLEATFGAENRWRFIDDCPGKLVPHPRKSSKQQKQDPGGKSGNPAELGGSGVGEMVVTMGGTHQALMAKRSSSSGKGSWLAGCGVPLFTGILGEAASCWTSCASGRHHLVRGDAMQDKRQL